VKQDSEGKWLFWSKTINFKDSGFEIRKVKVVRKLDKRNFNQLR